jgi:hypothetical protein
VSLMVRRGGTPSPILALAVVARTGPGPGSPFRQLPTIHCRPFMQLAVDRLLGVSFS